MTERESQILLTLAMCCKALARHDAAHIVEMVRAGQTLFDLTNEECDAILSEVNRFAKMAASGEVAAVVRAAVLNAHEGPMQ